MSTEVNHDRAANLVLQELHQVIADNIEVDYIVPQLWQKRYLSLKKVQYFQNPLLTDQHKKDFLLYNVLMNGGYMALKTLLDVLDETSQQHQPHVNLAIRLRKRYRDVCTGDQIDQRQSLAEEPHNAYTLANNSSTNAQSIPQIPDIIPQILSQFTQSLGNATSPVTTKCDCMQHSSTSVPAGPACNYFIAVSGALNQSCHSSSLNDDTQDDHMRQNSSKASQCHGQSTSHAPSLDPAIFNYEFEGIDEEPDEYFMSQKSSFVDSSPRKCLANKHHHVYCCHDKAPAMFANEPPSGVVSITKQNDIIKKKATDTSSAGNDVAKPYVLDEFDVIPVLKKSLEPLSNMVFMKLVLLGQSGVGKTSIIKRFLYNDFGQTQNTIGSTHGTCYCQHTTRNVNINLAIWDTAGQERFHSICPMYYRDADAILMVFDVTNISTLHAVENYWSNVLQQNLSKPDVPILLVGNKCDAQVVSEEIKQRAKQVVQKRGFKGYRETSAKNGYEVNAVFETIASLALESQNIKHCQDVIKLGPKFMKQPKTCYSSC